MIDSLGFTGTQKGMRGPQGAAFHSFLMEKFPREFHHGDCIGSDQEAHNLIMAEWGLENTTIIVHPPTDPKKRAFCPAGPGVIVRPPKAYIDRNHDIVDETGELVATPSGFKEVLRSGTWATVRYARKLKRPVTLIFPDGTVSRETT